MSRRLRWQVWVPRFLLLVVVGLAAQYGLGIVARSHVLRFAESELGAHAEIGNTRVSLLNRQVILNDVRLSNPNSPGDSFLEADRCELSFAPAPLLHKQAVVTRGRLLGVQFSAFGTQEPSAQLQAQAAEPADALFHDHADAVAAQWFNHLAERIERESLSQFDSVQGAEALCARWSTQSADLEARGQAINERVAALQKSLTAAESNPLRGDKVLTDLPKTIGDLQSDIAKLNGEFAALPEQLETERRAIVAARRRDELIARKSLALDPIEANALSAYLLRTQVVAPLNKMIGYVRWMREASPATAANNGAKHRGEDILFGSIQQTPNLLVEMLELRGSARIAGQPVDLRGSLTNFSTQPELLHEPTRLRLTAAGSMPLELQAIMDRTQGAKRDSLLVDCQGILLPQMSLGDSQQLAMTIAPSLGSLSVSLAVDGENLTGDIQLVQQNVRITPVVAGKMAAVPINDALGETLGHIDSLATRVSLHGTLDDPSCALWSNLGPAVAEAFERALDKAIAMHARNRLVEAGKHVDEQLTGIERQMSEQQSRWSAVASDAHAQLQTLAAGGKPDERISIERIGRRLPTNSLFR